MKKYKWTILGSLGLLILSTILYIMHYRIFGQLENTLYYSFMDICFIPINILIVSVVFQRIYDSRTKYVRMHKINMLVGLFFNEMGYSLMSVLIKADPDSKELIQDFSDLKTAENIIKSHRHKIKGENIDFDVLEDLLTKEKDLLISLMGNENILEHETFTDLLMSVFHLRDEISFRKRTGLSEDDLRHLQGDILRVYKVITIQWVHYLGHLKNFYPYLYSSALMHNPFNSAKAQ